MSNVLFRYIAWQTFRGIFIAFVIVTSIIMLVDFVEGTRNIGADANINAGQQKWPAAKNYYREASKLAITERQIKAQMDEFGKALKNRGAANVARSMGKQGMRMMQQGGGGKRRRPKMR